ncbi:hypothetical protein F183_A09200 [Bryobacterales bacterium F-183]|nr:hypothetical protein F183_A09200 [Bryobacterales bacterium F-183]
MGGVDAHDEGPVAELGKPESGGRRDGGLADAAFAAVEKDSHTFVMPKLGRWTDLPKLAAVEFPYSDLSNSW